MLIGASISTKSNYGSSGGDAIGKLREVMGLIQKEYVDDPKSDELVEDAIQHMLTKLDPHSAYISAKDREEANEDLRGNFEGIGIEFNIFHDTIVVVSPLGGGPSEAVGLRSGDKIVKVDSTLVAGVNITNGDVMKYLKGPKGSEVKIEIARKNEKNLLPFTIIRDKIPQYSV